MVRIGSGVFPVIQESDYLNNGEYRIDKDAAPKMLQSLMYVTSPSNASVFVLLVKALGFLLAITHRLICKTCLCYCWNLTSPLGCVTDSSVQF